MLTITAGAENVITPTATSCVIFAMKVNRLFIVVWVYIIKEIKDFPTNPQRGDDLPRKVDHQQLGY
jgi:hypothetical protein